MSQKCYDRPMTTVVLRATSSEGAVADPAPLEVGLQ